MLLSCSCWSRLVVAILLLYMGFFILEVKYVEELQELLEYLISTDYFQFIILSNNSVRMAANIARKMVICRMFTSFPQ